MFAGIFDIVLSAYRGLARDDGLALAGNIAFCMILALFPFLIFLTALAGLIGDEALAQTVIDYLLSVAPEQLTGPLTPEIHYILTAERTDLLALSVVATLWTASGAVESVRIGLDRAYGFSERRPFWFRLVQNAVFVIGGAVVLLVLAAALVFGPLAWSWLVHTITFLDRFSVWFHLLRYPVSIVLLALALVLAHLYLPVRRHRLRELLPGIAVTMVLWLAAAAGFSHYLASFSTIAVMYQGLTGIIIALIFVYFSGALLIWGGEINQVLIARAGAKVEIKIND